MVKNSFYPNGKKMQIDNSRMSRRQSKITPPLFLYLFPAPLLSIKVKTTNRL